MLSKITNKFYKIYYIMLIQRSIWNVYSCFE